MNCNDTDKTNQWENIPPVLSKMMIDAKLEEITKLAINQKTNIFTTSCDYLDRLLKNNDETETVNNDFIRLRNQETHRQWN